MKIKPIQVLFVDDEFPKPQNLRSAGIFNSGISTETLYKLAVDEEWPNNLVYLQQLIKDIVSNQVCKEGLVELIGFSSPTQVLSAIENGLKPDVMVYDWEYINSTSISSNSKKWLLEILEKTDVFAFVYSYMRDELPKFLNSNEFFVYINRFQLFKKGGGIKYSFSSEEFIFQYIVCLATKSGDIKINDTVIKFNSNNYLNSASDILYLQRILGSQYVLDELPKLNFSINDSSVEKLLNDSNGFLYFSESKKLLISSDQMEVLNKVGTYVEMSFLEVAKRFSLKALETTLEKGIYPIIG